jgi:hypothetical protein
MMIETVQPTEFEKKKNMPGALPASWISKAQPPEPREVPHHTSRG